MIANTFAKLLRDTHGVVLPKLIIKVLKRPRGRPVVCRVVNDVITATDVRVSQSVSQSENQNDVK